MTDNSESPAEHAEEKAEEAREAIDESVEAEGERQESIEEAAEEAAGEVTETISDTAEAVEEEAEGTAETAAEAVEELVEETKDAAEDAAEAAGIPDIEEVTNRAVDKTLERLYNENPALRRAPVEDVAERVAEVEESPEVDLPGGDLPVDVAEPVIRERDPIAPNEEHWYFKPRSLRRRRA